MFSRISTLTVLALGLLAVATPGPNNAKRWGSPPPTTTTVTVTAPASTPTSADSCDTGDLQCCASTTAASSPAGLAALELQNLAVEGVDVLLGLGCSPISVISIGGGNACSASPVCCQDNAVGGLISIGCVPITL